METGDRDRKTYQITERGIEYINKNEKELNDIKRKLLAYKAFLELGGEELKEAFKQLFKSIDNLNEAQREELESTFRECARKIKLLLLGERA
ncbi:hypothetical protein [Thermococcus sp.]|uniref:hypothetical protein n=1 Tax=Thermococcus sp. TaxID=35749 RepID=UPI0026149052|nr:hypothetical protein [Thermococcus sp.]